MGNALGLGLEGGCPDHANLGMEHRMVDLRAGSSHSVDSTDTQEEMLVSLLPYSVPVWINFSGALTPFHVLSILPQVELKEPGCGCVFHRELFPGSAGQEGNPDRKRSTWP